MLPPCIAVNSPAAAGHASSDASKSKRLIYRFPPCCTGERSFCDNG